jgi:hypothetical protein
MFRRRDRARAAAPAWREPFEGTLEWVEQATAALVSAAPRGRPSPVPVAEALARFELDLREAEARMAAWRSPENEEIWSACHAAVAESLSRAEHLRLERSPQGYEELIEELDALLEPLGAFEHAADELGRTG